MRRPIVVDITSRHLHIAYGISEARWAELKDKLTQIEEEALKETIFWMTHAFDTIHSFCNGEEEYTLCVACLIRGMCARGWFENPIVFMLKPPLEGQ